MRVAVVFVAVLALAAVAVRATESEADADSEKPHVRAKVISGGHIVLPHHLSPRESERSVPHVVIVPKGDPRARPAGPIAAAATPKLTAHKRKASFPRRHHHRPRHHNKPHHKKAHHLRHHKSRRTVGAIAALKKKTPTKKPSHVTPTKPAAPSTIKTGAGVLKAAAPSYSSAACTAKKGTCISSSSCSGSVVKGICPGPATITCCVPKGAAPAPASSSCLSNFNPSTLASRALSYQQAYKAHGVVYSQPSRQFGAAPPVKYSDCSSFVTSVLDSLGWDCLFASGRYTGAMIPIMQSRGGFHSTAKTGDIVMWSDHTGIVVQACSGGNVRMVAMGLHGCADTGCISVASLKGWGSGSFLGFWTPK